MATRDEAWEILNSAEELFSAEAVSTAVDQVAEKITAQLGDAHPLILCVMTGGLVFTGQLMTRLRFPADVDYLHATRYSQDNAGGSLSWRASPWISVKDRTVLVVDDILDEGVTLAAVRDKLLAQGAKACHLAVLADKANGKNKPVKADFVALTVPDRFVFGCGMDAYGAWRNLGAIYAIPDPVAG